LDETIAEINNIGKWVDDCFKRSDLSDYNALMQVGIESGNYIRDLIILCTGTLKREEYLSEKHCFNLHDAVIVGHLVRIFKLYNELVYFVSEKKGEISSIFSRLVFETYATMKYLILNGKPSIDSFIKSSFKATIGNYKYIKEKEAERPLSNIEKRILIKIENRLNKVNLSSANMLNNKQWKIDNKSFREIITFLKENDHDVEWDKAYTFVYGSQSAFIHGTWYDIQINHLEEAGNGYLPKYSYDPVDPRYILPVSLIPIQASIDFLLWRKADPDKFLINVLNKMSKLLLYLNEMDEIRIDRKRGVQCPN
jgi:hypothetical protein